MSLASALLQPQRFGRISADANVRLMEDVGRTIAVMFEDLATDERMARAVFDAAIAMGPRVQHELEARFRNVASNLRIRAQAFVASFQDLGGEIAGIGDDAGKAIALITKLLALLTDALASLSYPGLRERVRFVVDLIEKDLGLSAAFIEGQILAFLNDAAERIVALDNGGDPAVRRQHRACASTLRRLACYLQTNFQFPGFDVDAIARALYNLLRDAGVEEIVRQARCALTEFEVAVASTEALGAA